MKTLIIATAFVFILSFTASAQLEKGNWIGGVNGNFGVGGRSASNRLINWSFNPSALYLVKRNFAVGIEMDNSFVHYRGTYWNGSEDVSQKGVQYSLQLAPTVRKYFGNGKLRPYVGISTGLEYEYSRNVYSSDVNHISYSKSGFFLAPQAGVSWWMNHNIFFDLKASYKLIDSYHGLINQSFNTTFGVGFRIGR